MNVKKSFRSKKDVFFSHFSIAEKNLNDAEILERDMQWLSQAHVVIAEVTQPSLGVGFEIARAITLNKPVLCLFRPSSGQRKRIFFFILEILNFLSFSVKVYQL